MSDIKVGQFWIEDDGEGVSLVLGVRDDLVLADYRQGSCDSRVFMATNEPVEFKQGRTLVTDRQELTNLVPSEWNALVDFYLGEEPDDEDDQE